MSATTGPCPHPRPALCGEPAQPRRHPCSRVFLEAREGKPHSRAQNLSWQMVHSDDHWRWPGARSPPGNEAESRGRDPATVSSPQPKRVRGVPGGHARADRVRSTAGNRGPEGPGHTQRQEAASSPHRPGGFSEAPSDPHITPQAGTPAQAPQLLPRAAGARQH